MCPLSVMAKWAGKTATKRSYQAAICGRHDCIDGGRRFGGREETWITPPPLSARFSGLAWKTKLRGSDIRGDLHWSGIPRTSCQPSSCLIWSNVGWFGVTLAILRFLEGKKKQAKRDDLHVRHGAKLMEIGRWKKSLPSFYLERESRAESGRGRRRRRERGSDGHTRTHVQGETNIGTLSYALPETNGRLICSFAQCHA